MCLEYSLSDLSKVLVDSAELPHPLLAGAPIQLWQEGGCEPGSEVNKDDVEGHLLQLLLSVSW